MSTAGLYADVVEHGELIGACLLIGDLVPRIHHTDGLPVYYVAQHADGPEIAFKNGERRRLVAYPSAWPAPGARHAERYVYTDHEHLPFNAPVPLHDIPEEVPDERLADQLH